MSAIIEQEANDVECQRLRGKPVIYGSVIQLFNMHCKRFLCVNPKRTCVNEPTSMAVDIDRNMKRECLFRILPKFRIRAEGEPVRVGDAIVLKSLTTEGHLSVARFSMMNEHIGMEVHEAAASSYKHGWTMKLFQPTFSQQPSSQLLPSSSQSSRVIHGGYFIRLYHKEKEAYMMCQSLLSLALSNYDAAGFDEQKVQLLEYKYDPLNPQDSKSSLVVWQIEFANAYTGDAIEWNKPVRLRHASSNLYLAVLKDQEFPLLSGELSYVVDLINRPSGDERNDPTLFQFANVNSESTQLSASAYTRIRHIQTGAWLHAAGSFRLDSRGRSGPGIGGVPLSVQSDFNKYHIVATSNAHLDDYFSLSIVDQDLMDKIRFVKGMTPWLIKTISKPRFKPEGSLRYPFGPRELKTLTNMMVALIYFCTRSTTVDPFKREGSPILLHQTLLRECSIIEAVLKLLQVPMDLEQRRTIRVAYEELRIREGSDRLSVLSAENIVVPPLSVQDSAVDDSQESLQANSLEREEYVTTLSALKAGDEPGLAAIFRHIYRLLKQFLLGSDHENQVHVATAFDTFLNHLDLKVGAADTLMQLIEGNPSIVQSIDQQQILHFVNLLIRDRNPSCVNFLIALCHCDGMSIPSHQEFIAKHILGSEQMNQSGVHEDSPSHLFRTRIASGGGLEVLPPAGFGQPAWIPLVDLFSSQLKRPRNKSAGFDGSGPLRRRFGGSGSGSFSKKMTPGSPLANNEATAEIAEYFAALIKLYHALCLGHNATVVSWMVDTWKVISLRKCEVVLYDENLPPALRAQFCDLLTVLFVDKFPISPSIADFIFPVNTIENRPSLRYILEDAALEDGKLEVERLSAVTGWLSQFLSQQTQHLQEDKEQNELVLSSLKLLKQLVAFGFVQEENDIISLFLNLTEILDGTTDLRDMEMKEAWSQLDRRELARDPWFTVDRFEMNEINSPIINAKIEICAIMENLLRLRLEMRVYMFLHHWYKFFKQDGFKAKKGSLSLTAEDSSLGFKDAQTLFKSIMEDTAYFKLNDRLSPICLDLLQYESPRLKKRSIRMLHRLHSSVEEILQLLRISLLINDNTYQTSYDWMKTQISVFIEYGVGTPAAVDYFDGTIIGGISESSAAIMQKVLQDFGHLCVAGSSTTGDTVEDEVVCAPGSDSPHSDRMRQWCLRNLGVYGWILALIKNRVTHSLAMANKRIAARSSSAARGRRSLSRDSVHSAGSQNDLAEHSDTHSRTTSPDVGQFSTGPAVQSELLLAIFQFIFYYANGNKEHQSTVFEDFDLLLEATHPSRSGASLMVSASCVSYLGRIFSQSVSLCLRITEDHIRRVLQLSGGVRGEYFELLRCIIKPEGKIIKKNQQAVMKLLLEKKRLYANMDDLLSRFAVITVKNDDDGEDDEEESLEKRKLSATAKKLRVATSRKNSTLPSSITPKKASEDQSASLDYYAELLKTIALCCEEKNYILQSVSVAFFKCNHF
ncbi:hypothetical protein DFJ73DRAFT_347572 [Zopfochytrium polystomum]|nr:hypothetical protein DFJ73DRAFT_347572 [Zopfochytrium polystomum]